MNFHADKNDIDLSLSAMFCCMSFPITDPPRYRGDAEIFSDAPTFDSIQLYLCSVCYSQDRL